MFKKREGMPSPALIVSIAALVIAMAGSAIALPGKATVKKDDIAKGAVTKRAIKKGAVTSKGLKDGSVTGAKIADATIGAGKIAAGVLPTYAFAYVDDTPAIIPEHSEGMGNATVTEDGSFICFYAMPFPVKNIQVTPVRPGGGIESSFPQAWLPGGDNNFCDGSEDASVQFYDASGSGGVDASPPRFHVLFNG
jgi:hypothetical protein